MTTHYDNIAWQYKKSKELPIRQYAETYTYFHLIGEMAGKTILDLACGEGFYTRQFKQKGARHVLGVDISEKMIELAQQEEAKKTLGIEYIVGDVIELKKRGRFDLVVASFLLNYAQTKEQLLRMCQSIYTKEPGTRFVSINNNSEQPPESYKKMEKYRSAARSVICCGVPYLFILVIRCTEFLSCLPLDFKIFLNQVLTIPIEAF